jgi:hypothetical protein
MQETHVMNGDFKKYMKERVNWQSLSLAVANLQFSRYEQQARSKVAYAQALKRRPCRVPSLACLLCVDLSKKIVYVP